MKNLGLEGEADFISDCKLLRGTRDDKGAIDAPAPKMDRVVCAHNFSNGGGRSRFASDCTKSLLCSLVRMGFSRQARAGLATSYCTLELVFVVFSAQWKGSSPQLGRNRRARHQGSRVCVAIKAKAIEGVSRMRKTGLRWFSSA
jgi:hypothetical protein